MKLIYDGEIEDHIIDLSPLTMLVGYNYKGRRPNKIFLDLNDLVILFNAEENGFPFKLWIKDLINTLGPSDKKPKAELTITLED